MFIGLPVLHSLNEAAYLPSFERLTGSFLSLNPVISAGYLSILLSLGYAIYRGEYVWTYTLLYCVRAFFTGGGKNGLLHGRLVIFSGMSILYSLRKFYNSQRSIHPVLGFLLTTPGYIVFLVGRERRLNWTDVVFIEVIIFALVGQLRADDLRARYEDAKKGAEDDFTDEELKNPLKRETFAYFRDPTEVFDLVIWTAFYLWGGAACGVYFNWTIIGIILRISISYLR